MLISVIRGCFVTDLRKAANLLLATFITSSCQESRLNFSNPDTSKTQAIKSTKTIVQLKNAESPVFCNPSAATTPKLAGRTVSKIIINRLLLSTVIFDPQFLQFQVVLKMLEYSKIEYL